MLRGYLRFDVHLVLLFLLHVLYHCIAWLRRVQRAGRMPVLVDTPGGQGVESLRTPSGVQELGGSVVARAAVDTQLDMPAAMPGMSVPAFGGLLVPSVPSAAVWQPLPVLLLPPQLATLPSLCLLLLCLHYAQDGCS